MLSVFRQNFQVGWIGKPVYKPLAVIRGPSGTYVVSKPVVIIGRDTAHANTDLIVQVVYILFIYTVSVGC